MREARLNGEPVEAGPHSPDVAICPECGAEVRKRRRRSATGGYTYFYRHRTGTKSDCCALRYRPIQW